MIGTSFSEHIFIRPCILGLRAITPLSFAYGVFCIIRPPQSTFTRLLAIWAAIEVVFYSCVYLPRRWILQRPATHPVLTHRSQRQRVFQKCKSTISDPENFLAKWSLDSPLPEVKRENLKDWLRWGFLNKRDFDVDDDEELDEYASGLEDLLGRRLAPGRGNARCLRLTLDDFDPMHRPFVWYMIVGLVDTLTAVNLRYHGFEFYRTPLRHFFDSFPFRWFGLLSRSSSPTSHLSYWYRPHKSTTATPILFIHGIGVGLYPYASFLADIHAQDPEVGIIALEILPISSRITHSALDKATMCAEINAILEFHNWKKIVLAAHSFGTVISTHLLQTAETEPKIGSILFMDPIVFLLHLPDVAYNFTQRKPRRANEHQLYYFASKDIGVAHTLARHFFWSQNILWMEDIAGRNVTVSLGGRDIIVNSPVVAKYVTGGTVDEFPDWEDVTLTGTGVEMLWFPKCDHAQVFDNRQARRKLVDIVVGYSKMD